MRRWLLLLLWLVALPLQATTLAGWLQASPMLPHLARHDAQGYDPLFNSLKAQSPLARKLILQAGALWQQAQALDTEGEAQLFARAQLARALWLGGNEVEARRHLHQALRLAEELGWSDAQQQGLLRDQALMEGDESAPLARRIAQCAATCGEERLLQLRDQLVAKPAERPQPLAQLETQAEFAETFWGEPSSEFAAVLVQLADALEEVRPIGALDHYQRALEQRRVLDPTPLAHLELELAIARLLLRSGDYVRLAPFTDTLARQLSTVGRLSPTQARLRNDLLRIRARGRRQQFSPSQGEGYREALAALDSAWDLQQAQALLLDLFDTRLDVETEALLKRLHKQRPRALELDLMQARLAQRGGDLASAIRLTREQIERMEERGKGWKAQALRHQLAAYLREVGEGEEAEQLVAKACRTEPAVAMRAMLDLRDHGAYEAAACLAESLASEAEEWAERGDYLDAQLLWQLAYTHARVGDQQRAFALMQQAAAIAVRHSFAQVQATSGGSLQLLKRDRWRYLLFLDIAWGARGGELPQGMSITSRY